MPMRLTATPATVELHQGKPVFGFRLCDPNEIVKTAAADTLKAAEAVFNDFVTELPPGAWVAHASWIGSDKAPRGFKAASDKKVFYRQIPPANIAA